MKYKLHIKGVRTIVILILLGGFVNNCFTLNNEKIGFVQQLQGEISAMNEDSRKILPRSAIQHTDVITEVYSDFSKGNLDNLMITSNGELSLKTIDTENWHEAPASISSPSERYRHSMVYLDGLNKGVLFGGDNESWPGSYIGDTWTYDVLYNSWKEMSPSTSPDARRGHDMVYSSQANKVILFGGRTSLGYQSDCWIYDPILDNWTEMSPSVAPEDRFYHKMVYSSQSDTVVLYGGNNGDTELNDTWVYDLNKDNWTQMFPVQNPGPRRYTSMVYLPESDQVLLFGGWNGTNDLNDTWIYDIPQNNWFPINPVTTPSARRNHCMVYLEHTDQIFLYGGTSGSDESWIYDLDQNTWEEQSPPTSPGARVQHTMITSTNSGHIILYGGLESNFVNETWSYDLARNEWIELTPTDHPGDKQYLAMAYSPQKDKIVIFGDWSNNNDETWSYDLITNTWTKMSPPSAPPPRHGAKMVYSSKADKFILYGGYNASDPKEDTWVYDLELDFWTQMQPLSSPGPRAYYSMVYASDYDKVILYGGYETGNTYGDTWIYDLTTNTWAEMHPIISPGGRYWHTMTYIPRTKQVILFGGATETGASNATWVYDLDQNTWTELITSTVPISRYNHGMGYNAESNQIIIHGGTSIALPLNDTWILDLTEMDWIQASPTYSPLRRNDAPEMTSMVDPVILFGGNAYSILDDSEKNVWTFGSQYHSLGFYESQVYSLDNVYSITGNIRWEKTCNTGLEQPLETSLRFQIGLSNTTQVDNFIFTDYHIDSFNFSGNARYIKYRVLFQSNLGAFRSPKLRTIEITYSFEQPEIYVPDPPSCLSALPGEEIVVLSWTPPSFDGGRNITHYNVYRGTSTGEYRNLGLSLAVGFTDRSVSGGTTYFYVVTAVNMIGESGFSNEISSTPTQVITATVPGSPQSLSISIENTTNNVVLDWLPPIDDGGETITHYNVYRGTSTEEYTYLAFSQDVGFTDRSVISGITYFYVVTAVNMIGESEFSNEASDTPTYRPQVTMTVPDPPQDLDVTEDDSTRTIILTWSPPSDDGGTAVTYYNIYRGMISGAYLHLSLIESTTTSFNDTLDSGGTYFYVVTAVNIVGESQFSDEVSGAIQPPSSASAPGIFFLLMSLSTMVVYLRRKRIN